MSESKRLEFGLNGKTVSLDVDPNMPLLWVLRDRLGLTGTKYGCGIGFCGTCLVHVDGEPIPSCATPVASVTGKQVTTIEGLAADPQHPLIQAWLRERVTQCGYCQPGQIMAAAALLARHPRPSEAEIDQAMSPVLCRCGTYQRIRSAVRQAAELIGQKQAET